MNKKKKLVSSPSMTEQYFVGNNLLGEWGSMQMTVMSEDLLLNSKYIKMGREELSKWKIFIDHNANY